MDFGWGSAVLGGEYQVPVTLDYGATAIWALSGALLATRSGCDPTGVAAIALVSATGGGLLRDGIFLHQGPPLLLRNPVYIEIVALATLLVLLAGRRAMVLHRLPHVVDLPDTVGTAAFALFGMQLTLQAGLGPAAGLLVGVVNGFGGGLLRDLLLGKPPALLRPGPPQAVTVLVGCVAYLLLTLGLQVPGALAGVVCVAGVLAARLVQERLRSTTRAVPPVEP